jgi:hypothetical protein
VPGLSDEEAVDRAIARVLDSEGGPIESGDGPQATQPGKVSKGQSPASSHSPGGGRPAVTGRPATAGQPALKGRPADPGVAGQGHLQAR